MVPGIGGVPHGSRRAISSVCRVVPRQRFLQKVAAGLAEQRIVDDREIDGAAGEDARGFACSHGLDGVKSALLPAQLLRQSDAQERRGRGEEDARHAPSRQLAIDGRA